MHCEMALPAVAPIPPDFYVCDRTFYGEPHLQDCLNAASLLPIGSEPVAFAFDDHNLPRIKHGDFAICNSDCINTHIIVGHCEIMVDIGGQNDAIDYLFLKPDLLREMAGWLLRQCVAGSRMGGFVTMGLEETIDYLINPRTDFQSDFRKVLILL